jgi:hypothetical protein
VENQHILWIIYSKLNFCFDTFPLLLLLLLSVVVLVVVAVVVEIA